ncbi:MAG: S9 family peptidase [Planctomycetes bacterium]|nr:S9 family peptidase [Planctomycetota bacterium]
MTRRSLRPILALVIALACAGLASSQSEVMTPRHLYQVQTVTEVAISPDGAHVAYALAIPRGEKQPDGVAWSELWVVPTRGGEPRAYVSGEVAVREIAWKPDGSAITFLSKRTSDAQPSLHAIPLGGGEARRLVQLDSPISTYAWRPDGSEIALIAAEPESAEAKKRRESGAPVEIYEEDFRQLKIWIAPADGSAPARMLSTPGSAFALQWDPTGAPRLAATIAPTPLTDDSYMGLRLHLLGTAEGAPIKVFAHRAKFGPFAWSPDGKLIAAIAGQDLHDPAAARLFLGGVDADSELEQRFLAAERDFEELAWQDASHLLVLGSRSTQSTLTKVQTNGVDAEKDLLAGISDLPALSALSLSEDGQRAAFVGSRSSHPPEVYTLAHGESAFTQLSHHNRAWMQNLRLAEQSVVRYKARDGLEIEGVLLKPLDARADTRYPLILVVHGGPEAHVDDGWLSTYSNLGHIAAARGFALFFPNYRASTGRGHEFACADRGDPAGKEFDDLVDGVDHLIAMGLVDKDRVGVTGGSYGGYATGWCSTYYSSRFAAGVMFVGISNKISKVGTTDIPEEEFLVHAGKRPWDNWEFFLQRSPIYHADKCRTPLLILHGKEDPRVDPGQSKELYRHLKLRSQAPVRLVLYPGEGHGNRKGRARLDYCERLLQWMELYLAPRADGKIPPMPERTILLPSGTPPE